MCPDKSLLSAYYDGEAPNQFASRIAAHLKTCDRCRKTYEGFSSLSGLLKEIDAIPAPPIGAYRDIVNSARRNVSLDSKRSQVSRPGREKLIPLTAVAAIMAGILVGVYLNKQRISPAENAMMATGRPQEEAHASQPIENFSVPDSLFGIYGQPGFLENASFEGDGI